MVPFQTDLTLNCGRFFIDGRDTFSTSCQPFLAETLLDVDEDLVLVDVAGLLLSRFVAMVYYGQIW